jgi:hypothetical protein
MNALTPFKTLSLQGNSPLEWGCFGVVPEQCDVRPSSAVRSAPLGAEGPRYRGETRAERAERARAGRPNSLNRGTTTEKGGDRGRPTTPATS